MFDFEKRVGRFDGWLPVEKKELIDIRGLQKAVKWKPHKNIQENVSDLQLRGGLHKQELEKLVSCVYAQLPQIH